MQKVGNEGCDHPSEEKKTKVLETETDVVEGMQFDPRLPVPLTRHQTPTK